MNMSITLFCNLKFYEVYFLNDIYGGEIEMKKMKLLALALISFVMFGYSVLADEEVVAKIVDAEYASLDDALEEANNSDTIELLKDAKIERIAFIDKDLVINGNGKTVTIGRVPSEDGKLDVSSKVTLNNIIVNHSNDTDPTAAKIWSICLRGDAVLNLNNSVYTLTIHGMYAYPGATINLDNSKLIAHDMTYTAFQADRSHTYAYINLYNDSLLKIYDIRTNTGNGTNWFSIMADNSTVSVTDCASQGLVGGRLELRNGSVADYNNNEYGFTLYQNDYVIVNEGTTLNINDNGSGAIWQWGGFVNAKKGGNLFITGNGYNCVEDDTNFEGAAINLARSIARVVFEDDSNVKINNNYDRAITNYGEVYIGNNTEIMNNGLITSNGIRVPQYGGGIYNEGIMTIKENVRLYNNHARLAGDDIYNIGNISFDRVGNDWILDDCNDKINGWYDDSENARWEAHDEDNNHIEEVTAGDYAPSDNEIDNILSIKAAHDLLGKLVINYVDSDGNKLTEEEVSIDSVGNSYVTSKKDFLGYTFSYVEGEEAGEYIDGVIYVTYYYTKTIGSGDIEVMPPQTGVEVNTNYNNIIYYKRRED